jgi:hypothetical protein
MPNKLQSHLFKCFVYFNVPIGFHPLCEFFDLCLIFLPTGFTFYTKFPLPAFAAVMCETQKIKGFRPCPLLFRFSSANLPNSLPSISLVLFSHPTPCQSFDILPFRVVCHTSVTKNRQGLPGYLAIFVQHAWLFDLGEVIISSPYRIPSCCLPAFRRRRPSQVTHFEAQSLSGLLPNCQRLTYWVTP